MDLAPDPIVATRRLGRAGAEAIAQRYGVICKPDVPVHTVRRGASITDRAMQPRDISAASFSAMVRRNRFKTADRRAARSVEGAE